VLKVSCFRDTGVMYNTDKKWLMLGVLSSALVFGGWTYQAQAATTVGKSVAVVAETVKPAEATSMSTAGTSQVLPSNQPIPVVDTPASATAVTAESAESATSATSAVASAGSEQSMATSTDDTMSATAGTQVSSAVTSEATSSSSVAESAATSVAPTKPVVPVVKAKAVTPAESIDAWMPNKQLQQIVLVNLAVAFPDENWHQVSDITKESLARLTTFDTNNWTTINGKKWEFGTHIDGQQSFSLAGLEYATNLTNLHLGNNLNFNPGSVYGDITDITPLQGLTKLTDLGLELNRISDITPITGLTQIKNLDIRYNQIVDLSTLKLGQYADLKYEGQIIENPMAYIPINHEYTMHNPIKAPQGVTLGNVEAGQYHEFSNMVGFTAKGEPIYKYYTASGGGYTLNGDQITFHKIDDQIFLDGDEDEGETTYPRKFYMYLVATFFDAHGEIDEDGEGTPLVTIYTPYYNLGAPVTVNYVDEAGHAITDAEKLSGVIDDDYQVAAKEFIGYQLVGPDSVVKGTYGEDAQTITFTYRAVMSTLTVRYQDTEGHELHQPDEFTGQVGHQFKLTTPEIAGYTYQVVPGQLTGTYAEQAMTVILTYRQNPTKVTINYVDDDTNKTLKTDTLSGLPASTSDYQIQTVVQQQHKQGYQLVGTYPTGQLQFGKNNQVVTIHFKHQRVQTSQQHVFTQTIHYRYATGQPAAADVVTQLTFQRQGQQDLVTKQVSWGAWTPATINLPAKVSPTIAGYQADQLKVAAQTGITPMTRNRELTVTYHPLVVGPIRVIYRDMTADKILQTVSLTGKFGSTSNYQLAAQLDKYKQQGYRIVSSTYPTNGVTFGTEPQTYLVQLAHRHNSVTDTKTVTQTIHYVYANGTVAAPLRQTTLSFQRTGRQDLVTGNTTWQAWTGTETTFPAQVSPMIKGYKAQQPVVAAETGITAEQADRDLTVVYMPVDNGSAVTDSEGDHLTTGTDEQPAHATHRPAVKPTATAPIETAMVGQGDQLQPSQPSLRPLVTHPAPQLPQTDESKTGHWLPLIGLWLSALVGGFVYRRRH